jgi:hypothetical protein
MPCGVVHDYAENVRRGISIDYLVHKTASTVAIPTREKEEEAIGFVDETPWEVTELDAEPQVKESYEDNLALHYEKLMKSRTLKIRKEKQMTKARYVRIITSDWNY